MDNSLSKGEKQWILYDVGNSAFILFATTVIPIVFNQLAKNSLSEETYFAYWGYAITASTVFVALIGPFLGALSDRPNKRKLYFTASVLLGVVACAALPVFHHWLPFLLAFVFAKTAYNASLVLYDSMLPDITTSQRMDSVSSHGYAWGYLGSTLPFVLSIGLIFFYEQLSLTLNLAIVLSFLLNALWWLAFSLPLIQNYQQLNTNQLASKQLSRLFQQVWQTLREIKQDKKIFWYLISFVFFIDGVYTIINLATAYGTSLGLSSQGLILAFLVTQLVAFPCALFFSRISRHYQTTSLIKVCILAYAAIALFAIQLDSLVEFWILAIAVGMFQGAIQALSRSYYAKLIPAEKTGQYFGIFDICGKGASIMGTFMVSLLAQLTGSQQVAVGSLAVMFGLGYFFFSLSLKD